MIQPTEAAALSAIHPSAQLTLWKQNEDNKGEEYFFIKEASSANLFPSIPAFQDATDVFSFSRCRQHHTHSHADVRTAVVEAWMSALVMILTLSASESMCSLCCCLQLCSDCRALPKQI